MASVALHHVSKKYGKGDAFSVRDLSLDIEDKEFLIFVGPSGCGKSTTLRMIAGLEQATGGDIYIGSKRVNDTPPKKRDIAMVFQNYALYPNMSVFENMAFGLRLRKVEKHILEASVKGLSRTLEIEHLLGRKPSQLSGGQRQRVALGRAIVRKPQVFLMDEPLSNLDAKLRAQMREEIIDLHRRLETTFIYVTHDQVEAMTMGTRICIMKDGVVQQVDTPDNVYQFPANQFVAGFIGSPPMNFLSGKVIGKENRHYFDTSRFSLLIRPELGDALRTYVNRAIVLGIRPEHILPAEQMEGLPSFAADVRFTELVGADRYVHLEAGDQKFTMRVASHLKFADKTTIRVGFNPTYMNFFHPDHGAAVR